jgi:hypothetical protein
MVADSIQLWTMWFTGVIAVTTVVYAAATLVLMWMTRRSVELAQRALVLSALMQEAELTFRESEQHPDGSQRFGGERSPSRVALREYRGKIRRLRMEMEGAAPREAASASTAN